MSKSNLKSDKLTDDFKWFCEMWLNLKNKAKETDDPEDWKLYADFLTWAKKDFTKVYIGMTNPKWIELMEDLLKTITCNLKEIDIKYKKGAGR